MARYVPTVGMNWLIRPIHNANGNQNGNPMMMKKIAEKNAETTARPNREITKPPALSVAMVHTSLKTACDLFGSTDAMVRRSRGPSAAK